MIASMIPSGYIVPISTILLYETSASIENHQLLVFHINVSLNIKNHHKTIVAYIPLSNNISVIFIDSLLFLFLSNNHIDIHIPIIIPTI